MSTCATCGTTTTYVKKGHPHTGEYCSQCHRWIRWIPKPIQEYTWPIGTKHKGKPILDILKTDKDYLQWAADNISDKKIRARALEALSMEENKCALTLPLNT